MVDIKKRFSCQLKLLNSNYDVWEHWHVENRMMSNITHQVKCGGLLKYTLEKNLEQIRLYLQKSGYIYKIFRFNGY